MRKFCLVFWNEYRYHVFRWRFLWTLLTLPLGLLFMLVLMAIMIWFTYDHAPVGIVDQAGFFDKELPQSSVIPIPGIRVQFQMYPSDSAARAALDAGQIKIYYLFPADFREKRKVDAFYTSEPEITVRSQVNSLVRRQYLRAFPPDRAGILAEGPTIVLQSLSSTGSGGMLDALPESTLTLARMMIPYAALFVMMAILTSSSGYLSQAIADEKANRTIEVLVTSVSPEQLMTGKIIALVSVGMTQLIFWGAGPMLLAGLAAVNGLRLDRLYPGGMGALLGLVSMALPTLLIYAALIVMITISFGDPREGQQFTSLVFIFYYAPMFLLNLFMASPNGMLPMVLSFFPLTSLTAFLIRSAFTTLPAWQIAAGWAELMVAVVAVFWLAARVFRVSMLRYGKPIFGKAVFSALMKRAWPARFRKAPVQGEL